MRKAFVLVFIGIMFGFMLPTQADAQDVLNGIYVKYRDKQRKPIPYKKLREADVMWSKFIMQKIDLREKLNHPLYYPTQSIQERMSLIDLLLHGIQNEGLMAYNPDMWAGKEFDVPMTWSEIMDKFDAVTDTQMVYDVDLEDYVEEIIVGELTSSEVKQYIVKEMWYFDRKYSTLNVRIIGLCPIREFTKDTDEEMSAESLELAEEGIEESTQRKLFWIAFEDARPLFANHEVFNPFNDAERRTFDDIFFKRKFSSYIIQESNVYDNRDINEYSLGMETMLEANRLKTWVFNLEQDLWQY